MKLSGFKADYQWFSAKTSDVSRQLALSGFAVVWVFKIDGPNGVARVPAALLGPALLLAIALGLDLVQYLVATLIWGSFHRWHERHLAQPSADPELTAPRYFNWPANTLFLLKETALIGAWAGILRYLFILWQGP
jgi:hypothetical protein